MNSPQIPYKLANNPTQAEILAIIELCHQHLLNLHYSVTITKDVEKYKPLVAYLFPLVHSKINSNEFSYWVKREEERLKKIIDYENSTKK